MDYDDNEKKRPYDIYRDSMIRSFGYGGHIGGALRPFVPYSVVNVSRAVATAYIVTDIIDKASKEAKKDDKKRVYIAAGDAMLWQMLASVLIPGIILSGVQSLRCNLMCRQSYTVKRIAHTGMGLLTIALIMKPIDKFVDIVLDNTYREWTKEPIIEDKKKKKRPSKVKVEVKAE